MWLPGHLAFSLLLCIPLVLYLKRERAMALAVVAAFALLPDYLHLGMLRAFSHSFLGLAVMLAVGITLLIILFRPRVALIVTAVVSATGHLLADLYIGTIWPWYPWSDEWLQVHLFNTPFDIRTEVVLSIIALIILAALGPLRSIRPIETYSAKERALTLTMSAIAAAMAILQSGYFLIVSQGPGLDLFRSALLAFMLLAFLAALAVFLFTLRTRPGHARQEFSSPE